MIYGYARVSTVLQAKDGNSLEAQVEKLKENGATEIFADSFTGTKKERPELDKLLNKIQPGDTFIACKLDRVARSLTQGSELISELIKKGIRVNILNIGIMDNTPSSKLIRNIFFAFAEFERDMIVERTQEGREISKKTNPNYVEGRPKKFTDTQLINACKDLKINGGTKSYKEVMKEHKMSKGTIISANNKFFPKKLTPSENFYKNIEDTTKEYYKN